MGAWAKDVPTNATRLILNQPITTAELSPDRSQIVFGLAAQIWVASVVADTVQTGSITQLTTIGRNFFPTWSPSGLEIAFDNTDCSVPTASDACGILVMNRNGSGVRVLARGRMPAWSPEGAELVYVGLGGDLYRVDYGDPSDDSVILAFGSDIVTPRYSPDGGTIAFVALTSAGDRIWLVDADGSNPRELVIGSWPAWSPDGTAIAFARPSPSDPFDHGTLWAIDLGDRSVSRLTYGVARQ